MASESETGAATAPLTAELRELQGLADSFGRAMTMAFRRSVVDGNLFTGARGGVSGAASGGSGTRGMNVVFNVTTPDAQSFRRSEGEVSAMLARAVARGQRGL